VVGNPPYGAAFTKEDKAFLSSRYDSFQLDFDSYIFFLESSLSLTRAEGHFAFIVPEMWLRLETNENLRKKLLNSSQFKVIRIFGRVFEEAVVYTCVPILKRQASNANTLTRVILSEEVNVFGVKPEFEITQLSWLSSPFARIEYLISPELEKLLDKIVESSFQLGDVCEIVQGLTAYDRYSGQNPNIIATRAFHADQKKDKTYKKWLGGGDVSRYFLDWSGKWISYGPWLAAPRDPKIFKGPRILVREVPGEALRIQAQLTNDEYYYGHSITPCLLEANETRLDLLFLLSVVNSLLLSFYGQIRLPNFSKATFPKLNPSDVQALPIRRIAFTTSITERARLMDVGITEATEWIEGTQGASVGYSEFCGSKFGRWLDARLSADPEQADVVQDLLAHLAERMIEMNKEKQKRLEAFWLDLEGVTEPATFNALRNKGKQERTLWRSEATRPYIEKGSHSTRHLDESLGWDEDAYKAFIRALAGSVRDLSELVAVYRRHSSDYRTLVSRIGATDRLIDLTVYRLYGLTEEEVAVVEGEHG